MPQSVIKSDGEEQKFSPFKLRRSLRRAGVDAQTIDDIVADVSKGRGKVTTNDIHKKTYKKLVKCDRPMAARYNLKRALSELGPSGYPFEQFFSRLLEAKGYDVVTNKIVRGMCVSHEVDVLGTKDKKHFVFECKFHNRTRYKSDIQTVLYMKARYDDIRARWEQRESTKDHIHKVWIVTNTQFTSEARRYARCASVGLMAWRQPAGHSLAEMIEETGLHPITALTSLTKKQKAYIVSHDLVLCREAESKRNVLIRAGVRGDKLKRVIREAEEICRCA